MRIETKQFLLKVIFLIGILVIFVSNSPGQPIGDFETTLYFEENSHYYHALATGKYGWSIGREKEIEQSKDTAIQRCTEKNADSNCQIETVAPIDACIAVTEGVEAPFSDEEISYYWIVEDSLEIAIPKALELCGDDSLRCALAIASCGTNAPITNKFLKFEAQVMLSALGFNPGPIDGILGPLTKKALNKFRRDNGLSPQNDLDSHIISLLTFSFYNQFPTPRERYALVQPSHERFILLNNQQSDQISSETTSPSTTNNECSNNYVFSPPSPNGDYGGWGVWIHDTQTAQWIGPEIWSQEESREIAIKHYSGQPTKITNLGGCPADSLCMTFAYPIDGSWAWIGCGTTQEEALLEAISTCEIKHGCECKTIQPGVQNTLTGNSEGVMCLSPQQLAAGRDFFENRSERF